MNTPKQDVESMKEQVREVMERVKFELCDCDDHHDLYETLDENGSLHEIIDGNISIYYHDLRKWAVDGYEYIEQAMEDGLCEGVTDFHKLIQCGQYVYFSDVCRMAVHEIWEELLV